ncbi:MAG: phage holin family protein [Bacteroidales bacterium]|nr:phage holin family protein [Bacteroidales bacterium]
MSKKSLPDSFAELAESVKVYLTLRLNLFKLSFIEKASRIISLSWTFTVVAVFFSLFLGFLSIAGALWLGDLLNNTPLGFLIIAGFYLLLFVIFLAFRKQLIMRPIIKIMAEIMFSDDENSNDE